MEFAYYYLNIYVPRIKYRALLEPAKAANNNNNSIYLIQTTISFKVKFTYKEKFFISKKIYWLIF